MRYIFRSRWAALIWAAGICLSAAHFAKSDEANVAVDAANDVIIARWQGCVYAFSLRCPHRGTRLEWHPDETRIFCPRHKARFRADGAHDSGRASRDLDRYDVRRQGEELIVDFDALLRADVDAAAWSLAMVKVA